jgi:ureidoglycolate hydrolase
MEIQKFEFKGEGLTRVYENAKWMVGIKNWKPANDITGIDCLERHNETDELFILLAGGCTLLSAEEGPKGLAIKAIKMEPMKVYNIPRGLWHNTVTTKEVKLILVEDSATGAANSEVLPLKPEQLAEVKRLLA